MIKLNKLKLQIKLKIILIKLMNPKIYNRAQLLLPKENNFNFYEIYKKNFPINVQDIFSFLILVKIKKIKNS